MNRIVVFAALLCGCPSTGGTQKTPPASPPAPASRPASGPAQAASIPTSFLSACKHACARENMARAVGAEMIDAQCARGCEIDWTLPACRNGGGLAALRGKRARLFGTIQDGAVRLQDGTVIELNSGSGLDAGPLPASGAVVVVGVVSSGREPAVDQVTTVAAVSDD